jgi:hypothetical protein
MSEHITQNNPARVVAEALGCSYLSAWDPSLTDYEKKLFKVEAE